MAVASVSDERFERVAAEPRKGEYPTCSLMSHGSHAVGICREKRPPSHLGLTSHWCSLVSIRSVIFSRAECHFSTEFGGMTPVYTIWPHMTRLPISYNQPGRVYYFIIIYLFTLEIKT